MKTKTLITMLILSMSVLVKAQHIMYYKALPSDTIIRDINITDLKSQLNVSIIDTLNSNLIGDESKIKFITEMTKKFGVKYMQELMLYNIQGKNENVVKMMLILLSENKDNKKELAVRLSNELHSINVNVLKDSLCFGYAPLNGFVVGKLIGITYDNQYYILEKANKREFVKIDKQTIKKANETEIKEYY